MQKLSIATMTHNEVEYFQDCVDRYRSFRYDYPDFPVELVIVDDYSDDEYFRHILDMVGGSGPDIHIHFRHLNNDFAAQKNFMTSMCSGDWILNLDADEWVLDELIASIPSIIDENPHVEVYRLPRINTVVGLTLEHCNKWGWFVTQVENLPTVMKKLTQPEIDLLKAYSIEHTIDEDGTVEFQEPCVMWPDYQTRLYKRAPHIQWTGKVHETLTGHRMISNFPPLEFFAIRHFKTIDRQEQQNAKYSTIVR